MDGNSHEGKSGLGEPEPIKIVITPPSPLVSCAGDYQDVKNRTTEVASDGDIRAPYETVVQEGNDPGADVTGNNLEPSEEAHPVCAKTSQIISESTELVTNNDRKEETGTEQKILSPPSKDGDQESASADNKNSSDAADISYSNNKEKIKSETDVSEINDQNSPKGVLTTDKVNEKTEISKDAKEVVPNKDLNNGNSTLTNGVDNVVVFTSHVENQLEKTEITAVRVSVGLGQKSSDVEMKNSGISIGVNLNIGTLHSEKITGNIEVDVVETGVKALQEVSCAETHSATNEENVHAEEPQDEPKEQRAEKDLDADKVKEDVNKQSDLLKDVKFTSSHTDSGTLDDTISGGTSTNVEHNQQDTVNGDTSTNVEHNQQDTVKGDTSTNVEHNQQDTVKGDTSTNVEHNQQDTVKGDTSTNVEHSQQDTVKGDTSTTAEHNQQTITVDRGQSLEGNENIPQTSNTIPRGEDKSQSDVSMGGTNILKDKDLTSANVSTDTPLQTQGNAPNVSEEKTNTKPEGIKVQAPENRHIAFANVDDGRKMEASASAISKPSPESKLYFEHDAVASKFKEQCLKYISAKGFIPQTNKEHTVATNYRKDLILFCTVFAVYGTNYKKMLPRIRRQPSFYALFETRISQYNIFTGTITKRIGKNILTIERIANMAPHIVCKIIRDGNGKEFDLSGLGVSVPPAMQTTMFAGVCPSGPPAYCYYFYYQLSRKFFNRPVSINEIKKRVVTTFHSLLTTKERQDVCVKLNLATMDGEWMWNKKVLDVFEAAEKEWDKVRETEFSVRRVSLDFRDLLMSMEFEEFDLLASSDSNDQV